MSSVWISHIHSIFFLIFSLLEAPCDRPLLYLWHQHPQLISLAFFLRIVLNVTDVPLFLPQTVRVVIRWNRCVQLYVYDLHLLIYPLFCVLLCWLLILVVFVLFPDRGTSFGTDLEGLNILLRPWLQSADFGIVDTEACVIGSVQERDSWNGSVFAEWQELRGWLFGLVRDESLIEFIIRIVMIVEWLLIHRLGSKEGSWVKIVTKNEFKW